MISTWCRHGKNWRNFCPWYIIVTLSFSFCICHLISIPFIRIHWCIEALPICPLSSYRVPNSCGWGHYGDFLSTETLHYTFDDIHSSDWQTEPKTLMQWTSCSLCEQISKLWLLNLRGELYNSVFSPLLRTPFNQLLRVLACFDLVSQDLEFELWLACFEIQILIGNIQNLSLCWTSSFDLVNSISYIHILIFQVWNLIWTFLKQDLCEENWNYHSEIRVTWGE